MFRKKANIEDVYSCLRISEKCLSYYSSDFRLKVLDIKLIILQFEYQFTRDFDYKVYSDRLFFSLDNELHVLGLQTPKLEKVCHTQQQYVTAASDRRFLASSYRRKDKQYVNAIFDESCKLLWEQSGETTFRDVYDKHLLLADRRGSKIGYLNFEDCKILWQRELEGSIDGVSIETNISLIIPLSGSLNAFSSGSGARLWKLENALSFYNYDASNSKLYGLGGNTFEVINSDTGVREMQKELTIDLHIASHLTYYNDGLLYFSGYLNKNTPVFGAVNVNDGSLVFIQEVEMPGEKSFRKGLDRPVVVGNRLYVRDSMKTLHVYERVEDSL
ncbi:MAG: hypothetical protein R2806_20505 [Saprospiraceae bacterium]